MDNPVSRRTFTKLGTTAAIAMAASTTARGDDSPKGPNETIRVGVIGTANRGNQVIDGFLAQKDAQIVALCDVDQLALQKCAARFENKVDTVEDYRKLLDRKDIDAILVATPDHWHALQTIDACSAGKDVYCEKPLSITVVEGRKMVEAARANKRVVQVGLHRRSMPNYQELAKLVQDGLIGKVTVARAYRINNMYPNGIGRMEASAPPATLNWDMWLGPRADRDYQGNITPYKFRWWHLYSSQMGNWGVHYCDAIRWLIGEEAPSKVVALGGKFAVEDDRTIPDTMETTFQMPSGCLIVFGQYEASGNRIFPKRYEIELRGTKGTLYANETSYEIIPESGMQFQEPGKRMKPIEKEGKGSNATATAAHVRNFLDCMRTRETPVCDVEVGQRSTTFAHLGNIALATNALLEWDAANERFTNNDAANELLHYEYRAPWKLT